MKTILTFVFTLFFVFNSISNTIVDGVIKLPKHFKIENTFSGNLSDNTSFHLIFSKNKQNKNYTIHSYLFDGTNTEEIQPLVNKNAYSVVSFYQNNNVLTLLLSFKQKKDLLLKKVDINIKTKQIKESSSVKHDDFSTSFREKNRSVLVYETDKKLVLKEYSGKDNLLKREYLFKGENDRIKEFLKGNSIVSVKTDEFVANGAISNLRGYINGKNITLTKENKKGNKTEILNLDFSNNEINFSDIKSFSNSNGAKKFKKSTSYLNNNKLFQLGLNKKIGKIKVSDIVANKELNTIDINTSINSKIKGNKQFQGVENFLKNAGKNKYNATITVNNTKNNKVRVRVDYVNISYSYHYNWWWHHQQFMMWHQQHVMQNIQLNIPSGFGPKQPNDLTFENATVKKEKRFFELLIDVNGLISDEELPKTIYNEIDKKKYIDKLEENKSFKNISSCFLEKSFRFISYSKDLKGFIIQSNKIKG